MLAAAALGLAALGWATGTRLPGGKAGGDKGQGVTRGRGRVGAPRHGAFPLPEPPVLPAEGSAPRGFPCAAPRLRWDVGLLLCQVVSFLSTHVFSSVASRGMAARGDQQDLGLCPPQGGVSCLQSVGLGCWGMPKVWPLAALRCALSPT